MKIGEGKLCRLCLQRISEKNGEEIGEITKEILDVLLLTPDLYVTEERAICGSCMENIQNSFHFKSTCFYTEDYIVPFLRSDGTTKLDLREVYMNQNGNVNLLNITADDKICRLCLNVASYECFTYLHEVKDMLVKCIPELDFDSTREPIICTDCCKSLRHYFHYMENCLNTEEQIKKYCNFKRKDNKSPVKLKNVIDFIQKGGRNSSSNINENQDKAFDAKENVKSDNRKSAQNATLRVMLENCKFVERDNEKNQRESLTLASNDPEEINLYNCEHCTFKTKYRTNFKLHGLLHKDPSEIQWYRCKLCPYKEKYKRYLQTHLENHKKDEEERLKQGFVNKRRRTYNGSEGLKVYRCKSCSFRTQHRADLRSHEIHHDDIRWFRCATCPYKSKTKCALVLHVGTHKKEKKEIQRIFKCDKCIYQSNFKANLKNHAETHAARATLKMHHCEVCSYKSRRKGDVKDHMRKHEIKKQIKCEMCTFKTKYKESLTRHMITHKDPSELVKYKCNDCAFEGIYKVQLTKHILRVHLGQ